jgi:outer membrane receptor protein involved in Fe transport
MRQLSNQSLQGIDTNSASMHYGISPDGGYDYLVNYAHGNYVQAKNSDDEKTRGFYENFRDRVGVRYNDTVQTDSYDLYDGSGNSTGIFSLDLFSPDELLNIGNGSLVSYYGYDYKGSKNKSSSWDLKDFYVNKDDDNNFLRTIDAFRPVYMAGYIQDRFTFNDIIFNVGVRVDRFDANQKVLKDPYSLYELHHAGDAEVASLGTVVPDNIKSDYAVYVDNSQFATKVVGYRNENTWYDKNGTVITDLDPLLTNGAIQPFVTDYGDYQAGRVNPNAFTDYTPQVSVMPRIAFSFPISDEAYFAAHYDVLTQRPQSSGLLRFDPIDYLNWSKSVSGNFANPNLKPEKTTVYEINFQQKLSRSSAFSLTAFYKDIRDNIQFVNVDYAYPIKYTTYGNIDFGTVKGLTFGYDLRRTNNIRMNLSYTLQFADGTGSSATTNSGILAQAGQTNLREIKPFDFDQRHTMVASIDFHYGEGRDYNGPIWFNSQFLANTGLNFVFHAGSGAPYTRKSNITPEADFTTTANSRSVIEGSLNGSRYPWNFRIDAKLDKDFTLRSSKGEDGKEGKPVYLNVYLQVLNVLNTQNVTTVYAATGSPSDDGYIGSPEAASVISQQPSPQAYTDLYNVKINDPANYDLPRRIRLGIQVNF